MTGIGDIQGVLLDADGTLWDTTAAMHAAGAAAAREVWPQLSPSAAQEVGVHFRSDPSGYFRAFVAGEYSFDEMRLLRLREAADAFGLAWADPHAATFERAYRPHFDAALAAYDDTAPFLEWLATTGLPTRVLTNSAQTYTMAKVASAGLSSLEGRVCSRDCLGVGKPAPEIYLHAAEELGVDPAGVVLVGDEWATDVWGSREAGLQSIWLRRNAVEAHPEDVPLAVRLELVAAHGIPVVASLADLHGLLGGEKSSDLGTGEGRR